MEFMYRAGDPRRPSTGIVATSVNSESAGEFSSQWRIALGWFFSSHPVDLSFPWCEATHVQGDYSGDGSGFHGENSEAIAPRLASDHGELRRQAVKERIRERILREEAEALALEAEVWLELMEERIPLLRRPTGACAKGSEGRAAPVAVLSSAKMLIGHKVCFSSLFLTRISLCSIVSSHSRSLMSPFPPPRPHQFQPICIV